MEKTFQTCVFLQNFIKIRRSSGSVFMIPEWIFKDHGKSQNLQGPCEEEESLQTTERVKNGMVPNCLPAPSHNTPPPCHNSPSLYIPNSKLQDYKTPRLHDDSKTRLRSHLRTRIVMYLFSQGGFSQGYLRGTYVRLREHLRRRIFQYLFSPVDFSQG